MQIKSGYKATFFIIAFAAALTAGCGQSGQGPKTSPDVSAVQTLQITDIKLGEGAVAEKGKTIVVHYTGWLYESGLPDNKGSKFDSSVDRGDPFVFPLGAGRVIKGWDEGFAGMRVGGSRMIVIPPNMGYGARGAGGAIPPNATLIFDVELLDVL
ncbi:MAG: FKBP-type peptidyl-prolyl cis-trans isomerase [Gammaproteobacteria bacterium]|nr:FKBP-type peptidyl-prolyl cis-trans isomerase [Gammaproteobacteria bacterium]